MESWRRAAVAWRHRAVVALVGIGALGACFLAPALLAAPPASASASAARHGQAPGQAAAEPGRTPGRILFDDQLGTALLLAIQIAVFLRLQRGDVPADAVGQSFDSVVRRREYWRVVTGAFSHFDAMHLLFNASTTYSLAALERPLGFWNYLAVNATLVVVVGAVKALFAAFAYPSADDARRKTPIVGFSGVLFAWLTVEALLAPSFCTFGTCFQTRTIGGFRVNVGPIVSAALIQILVPRASMLGHLAGIATGVPLAWGWLSRWTPVQTVSALAALDAFSNGDRGDARGDGADSSRRRIHPGRVAFTLAFLALASLKDEPLGPVSAGLTAVGTIVAVLAAASGERVPRTATSGRGQVAVAAAVAAVATIGFFEAATGVVAAAAAEALRDDADATSSILAALAAAANALVFATAAGRAALLGRAGRAALAGAAGASLVFSILTWILLDELRAALRATDAPGSYIWPEMRAAARAAPGARLWPALRTALGPPRGTATLPVHEPFQGEGNTFDSKPEELAWPRTPRGVPRAVHRTEQPQRAPQGVDRPRTIDDELYDAFIDRPRMIDDELYDASNGE